MVLTRRGIFSTSVLCIVGVITLPTLVNLISNDLYYILQSWLSLRMRLLIVTVMIILCVFAVIMEVIYQKDRRLFDRLFKNIRLLLPLFKLFKGNSCLKVREPLDSQMTLCTRSGFKRAYDPLGNDPDARLIRNMLDSCREEGSRIQSLVRIHMALKVRTEQKVPDLEAALQSEYTTKSSRILHRRFEIGPETRNVDLDVLSLQIAKAMRLARGIDKNCTLQFGSFAFLKYTDGELKWWRLHEHWTPVIYDIRRCPGNIAIGERPKWIIRGSNLQEATLGVSTSDEKEEIAIVHRRKTENGEDEILFAEPSLLRRSALMFWRGVYICAWNSVSEENEGLTFNLQSESRNVTRAYWISVAEGFISNPRTTIIIIVNLVVLGTLGCVTHGTRSGMGCRLCSHYLGHLKVTFFGPNFDIMPKLLSMFQVLVFCAEFVILACWWFIARLSSPSGCPLPQEAGSSDLPVTDDPDLLSLVECVTVGEIDKARDEIRAQEECDLSRFSGPGDRIITPSVISSSFERLAIAQSSHHDEPLMAVTENPVSDLEGACLHPLKKTDTNIVGKEEEKDISASGVAETTAVADSDQNFSARYTTSDMIELESDGRRESIRKPDNLGDNVPGAITPESWSDNSCPPSPPLHEVIVNIKEIEEEKEREETEKVTIAKEGRMAEHKHKQDEGTSHPIPGTSESDSGSPKLEKNNHPGAKILSIYIGGAQKSGKQGRPVLSPEAAYAPEDSSSTTSHTTLLLHEGKSKDMDVRNEAGWLYYPKLWLYNPKLSVLTRQTSDSISGPSPSVSGELRSGSSTSESGKTQQENHSGKSTHQEHHSGPSTSDSGKTKQESQAGKKIGWMKRINLPSFFGGGDHVTKNIGEHGATTLAPESLSDTSNHTVPFGRDDKLKRVYVNIEKEGKDTVDSIPSPISEEVQWEDDNQAEPHFGWTLMEEWNLMEEDSKMQLMGMPQRFSYKELSIATRGFSKESKLGRGGFGNVYEGVLARYNVPVAVKKIHSGSLQGEKEFMAEVSIISQLRHRNLIQILGWCKDVARETFLLVYELMPNGSLDKALFGRAGKDAACLSWQQRYNIVTGAAAALDYLHQGFKQQVIHRNIKSSNIMLDEDWNAKLGDFGLARLVGHQQAAAQTMVAGTLGYIAPEVFLSGRFTDKTDVYSFGVVILEVACGRHACSSLVPQNESILVNWVWDCYAYGSGDDDLLSTVDKRLEDYDKQKMKVLLTVGLLCTRNDPEARPLMRHVVQMLAGDMPVPSLSASKRKSPLVLSVSESESMDDLGGPKTESTSTRRSGPGELETAFANLTGRLEA